MTDHKCFIVNNPENLTDKGFSDVCAAIGIFDGVHLGHQAVLKNLVRMAEEHDSRPVVITFFPHPRTVLDPEHAPMLLLPPDVKIARLAEQGVEAVIVLPFDKQLAALDAETFLDRCFSKTSLHLHGLCVGSRFRCGRNGHGTADVLAAYAKKKGFSFQAVDEIQIDGTIVSSSEIRKAAAAGELEKIRLFSGKPDTLYGYVEAGYGIAGKELNAPTANLHLQYGVLPPNGVYAAETVLEDGSRYGAAVNIGVAPTYTNREKVPPVRTEIHLLGFQGNLYNRKISVELIQKIRPEQKFDSPDDLKKQIRMDVEQIRTILNKEVTSKGDVI